MDVKALVEKAVALLVRGRGFLTAQSCTPELAELHDECTTVLHFCFAHKESDLVPETIKEGLKSMIRFIEYRAELSASEHAGLSKKIAIALAEN